VLVVVAALELALNRLAVPVLRPPGQAVVPGWHRDIDMVGLFSFHLSTVLALAVAASKLWELCRRRHFQMTTRVLLGAVGVVFLGLAAWGIFLETPSSLSFHLESCLTLILLLLALGVAMRPGDARVKLGLVLIAVPFLLHYYGTFALRLLLTTEAARTSSLPDRMRDLGQWSVALSSIGVALCFAPRPLWRSLLRPGPLAVAGFTGVLIGVVMVRHRDVGMEIASRGLGIEFVPGAPAPILVAFVLGAVAVIWALASTLPSNAPGRRALGFGLALVCIGGYAFAWPLTLLTVVAGALVAGEGALQLGDEHARRAVPEAAWRGYTEALAGELSAQMVRTARTTILAGERDGTSFAVALSPASAEIRFGELPDGPPALTVAARPEGLLGGRHHPPPPDSGAPHLRTGDAVFDTRFRVHGAAEVAGRIFDDGLRARAAAVLDGWVAVWPGRALVYAVFPGQGAPVDHPLPLRELAAGEPASPEPLLRVFELCAELWARAR
jgi:hypothetical protein